MKKIIGVIGFCGFMLSPSVIAMNQRLVQNRIPNNTSHIVVLNPAAKPFTYLAVHADSGFEVVNGMSGMMRDIIIKIVILMGYNSEKAKDNIKALFGICQEYFPWKKHYYFVNFLRLPSEANRLKQSEQNDKEFYQGLDPNTAEEVSKTYYDKNFIGRYIAKDAEIPLPPKLLIAVVNNKFDTTMKRVAARTALVNGWTDTFTLRAHIDRYPAFVQQVTPDVMARALLHSHFSVVALVLRVIPKVRRLLLNMPPNYLREADSEHARLFWANYHELQMQDHIEPGHLQQKKRALIWNTPELAKCGK